MEKIFINHKLDESKKKGLNIPLLDHSKDDEVNMNINNFLYIKFILEK
jgi:hypothetical protein